MEEHFCFYSYFLKTKSGRKQIIKDEKKKDKGDKKVLFDLPMIMWAATPSV